MKLMFIEFFIVISFIFLLFIIFIIRKRLIKKVIFLEIDENLKNLAPEEFFLNILKREKFSKIVNYTGFFLFLLFTFFIIFPVYKEYKDYSDFSITPIIPIFVWFVISANLLLALLIKKREDKRISEMLDNLEKSKLLKCAKTDFILSNKILETGLLGNDIKLGGKFLFVIYPGYIIPYYWIDDVKVEEIFGRYGSKSYYVNVILKASSKPINITFAKKEICEKIRYILLKRKYKTQNDRQNI